MYSSVILKILTLLCNPSPELFRLPQLKLRPHETTTPHFLLSPAPATAVLLSLSMNLTMLGILYKWNHTLFITGFNRPMSFKNNQDNSISVYLLLHNNQPQNMWLRKTFFKLCVMFHGIIKYK